MTDGSPPGAPVLEWLFISLKIAFTTVSQPRFHGLVLVHGILLRLDIRLRYSLFSKISFNGILLFAGPKDKKTSLLVSKTKMYEKLYISMDSNPSPSSMSCFMSLCAEQI